MHWAVHERVILPTAYCLLPTSSQLEQPLAACQDVQRHASTRNVRREKSPFVRAAGL